MWYFGMEGGNVFVVVLFGDVNLLGKLFCIFLVKFVDLLVYVLG